MKLGVLLFNLGGPEKLNDVKPFLYKLFSDPEIIRIPWSVIRKPLAYAIATLRRRTSEGYYRQIGGGSPLRRITEEQAQALKEEMRRRGKEVETFVGMSTWHPFFEEAVGAIERSGVQRLVILPLFPQYSVTTTGSGFAHLERLIRTRQAFAKLEIRWVRSWCDQPTYIESFVQGIQAELAKFEKPEETHILFSAHSIPESYVRSGDPYLEETKKTMECIMDRLGRTNPCRLSFQSKIGPVKWLSPFTNDVIVELAKRGIGEILVVPISFVSEHIETLYELDILYKKVADQAGVRDFRRVGAFNCDPMFIRALAEIVEAEI